MSIKLKLILIISGVFCLSSLIMGGFIYWQNDRVLTEHINFDVKNTINQTSQLVNFYINRAESNLTNLAADPEIIDALITKDPAKLVSVSKAISTIKDAMDILENVALMEINGSACIPIASNQTGVSALGKDFSNRDYCKGIIRTKATYLSSAYISSVNGNPVLGLVVPVKNTKGEMLGFVYGSLNLSELRGYLWDLQQGQDSKIELLDRNSVMFLNTEEKIEELGVLTSEEQVEIAKIKAGIDSNNLQSSFRDEDNFVGYKSNGSITLIYEKTATSLLTLTRTLNFTVFIALFISIILMIIVVYIFIGRITRRITRLGKITQEIAGGKFNIKLSENELRAQDETAVLARAFNGMASKLDDLYTNLDTKVKEKTKKLEQSEGVLKKNLTELEKMNTLMVGRELEMIKLKQELAKIKSNTKNPNK